jgi:hypothetical protein
VCHYSHGFAENGKHGLAAKCLVFLKRQAKQARVPVHFGVWKTARKHGGAEKLQEYKNFCPFFLLFLLPASFP